MLFDRLLGKQFGGMSRQAVRGLKPSLSHLHLRGTPVRLLRVKLKTAGEPLIVARICSKIAGHFCEN